MNAIPTVTKNLLIINVLVFLATIVAQSYHLDLARYLGLHFFLADDFKHSATYHIHVHAWRFYAPFL